ncbi:MAG: energy-coupling factor ABC transporter permease [Verrucomicrobiota bacterium]|jgi:cobalt/nickel transport system permease protein
MHIPDGFLDARTCVVAGALSAGGLAVAVRQVNRTLPRNKIPLMGLSAAFVFAAQMLNFPVAGGTSGHLLGGVLAAALLGPGAAAIVLACVLTMQALLFNDGGLLALGANIFNMSFVGAVGGWAIYRLIFHFLTGLRGRITAIFFAAWCSTLLAALVCAGELACSGTLPPGIVFPAMAGVHALIGLGEGLITALVILAIARVRPDLIEAEAGPATRPSGFEFILLGLIVALGLAIFVSPYACSWPDGLDRVAEKFGFAGRAALTVKTWFPDYKIPGLGSTALATGLAGALGVTLMFGLAWAVGRVLVKDDRQTDARASTPVPIKKDQA